MHLSRVRLRVRSPETLARFYTEHLGMTAQSCGVSIAIGYGGDGASIELCRAGADGTYEHARRDRYWKIGITLPSADIAYRQLVDAGVAVSQPRQFGDIGYMCHLQDPEGFQIELLQHCFGANRAENGGNPAAFLGGGAQIGQITLRTADIDRALSFYRDRLGMTMLSVQAVPDHGFTLYFLAFTEERPPLDDLKAVGNREWLWQRSYTTLELQHVLGATTAFRLPAKGQPGFAGIVMAGADDRAGHLIDEGGGSVELRG